MFPLLWHIEFGPQGEGMHGLVSTTDICICGGAVEIYRNSFVHKWAVKELTWYW